MRDRYLDPKSYVRLLDKREHYHLLQPVYSLNLVNEIFEKDIPEYYHYYRMVLNGKVGKLEF